MYQQKGDSAKGGGNTFWEGIPDVPFNPRSCFLPVGWGSRPWEMGFRPRTEITSLFASLMGRLTASLSGRLTAFLPQITKPVGPVMATGVLTVARFVGKVGCYLLVASLSGRLTAFHPPDHKASSLWRGCSLSRMLPLGRESLGTPHGVPPPQITKPAGPVIATGVLTVTRFVGKGGSYLLVASLSGRLRASLLGSLTVFHPQITKPVGPVIATGVLTVARFVPHGNWMTHLLANSPVGGCWARRPCHSLVGPPGATWVTPAKWWSREAPLVTRLWPWTQSMAISLVSALLMSL